jgi:hypothetical protein
MTRLLLSGLPDAPKRFERKMEAADFETLEKAYADDMRRSKELHRSADQPLIDRAKAHELAERLAASDMPETIASRRFMRPLRLNTAYAMTNVLRDPDLPGGRFITVTPKRWEVLAEDLHLLRPDSLLRQFRKALTPCLKHSPHGYLFCGLDIGWVPHPERWRPHMHMFATGDYANAVHALPKEWLGIPNEKFANFETRFAPIVDREVEPDTAHHVATYPLKSCFFRYEKYVAEGRIRNAQKKRISTPYYAQLLLWFDRFKVDDFNTRMGIFVTQNDFSTPYAG